MTENQVIQLGKSSPLAGALAKSVLGNGGPIVDKLLAVDPGPTQTAYVVVSGDLKVESHDIVPNEVFLDMLLQGRPPCTHMAIEKIEAMGMAVGAEVFETVFWTGRFVQACREPWSRITRREVKLHLCGSMRAKDKNIRQALIDKLGAPGTKAKPGGTYGIHGDEWSALAVALTWWETKTKE